MAIWSRSPPPPGSGRSPVGSRFGLEDWRIGAHEEWVAVVREAARGTAVAARPDEPAADVVPRRLAAVGARLHEAREAWADEHYPSAPGDAGVAALWAGWGGGELWRDQQGWLSLLLEPVTRAFRLALASRPPPPQIVARAVGDLRDALYYKLVSGGLAEIATYALETGPGGPVGPVFDVLSERGRALVARCVTRRGHWPHTVARVLPAAGGAERALLLQQQTERPPADWIELHTALRLVAAWGESPGDVDRDWSIVTQNQGRARGRLRAVALLEPPERLAEAVVALESGVARTRAAARRWAWSWAWEEVARGFSFSIDEPVIRPCRTEAGDAPLDGESLLGLEGWALLVILRGRGDTLARWARDGAGDRDGTWGRLLLELPEELRDADGGYTRVRAALDRHWPALERTLRPVLADIGALEPGRTLKARFWEVAGAAWHDSITKPRGGFPTLARHASAWVSERGSETGPEMHEEGEG